MSAAKEIFEDAREFETAFLAAMQARENAAVAEVCNNLRTKPESFGLLRALGWRERMLSGAGEDRTLALRGQIIAARQALNNERAEAVLDAAAVATLPAPPAPTTAPVVTDGGFSGGFSAPAEDAAAAPAGGATSRAEAPQEAVPADSGADAQAAEAAAADDDEDVSEASTGALVERCGAKARSVQAMLATRRGETGEEAQAALMTEANLLGGAGDYFVDTPDDLPALMEG
jgi:hypothetical protein